SDAFWRLPCYSRLGVFRIDPIVSRGAPSTHAHTLHGAQNLNFKSTYYDLLSSSCTSCAVLQDMSAYWTPPLMFYHLNGTIDIVPQVGGMLIYYHLFGENIKAFPIGFEMVAGDAGRRSASTLLTDNTTQTALAQRAVGFTCLDYKATAKAEGALERHHLPHKSIIDSKCTDGLRLELMFPSCWDGTSVATHDHKSHVAYPHLVREGKCPDGFESRLPALYYETVWNTAAFRDIDGHFLLSNGDHRGYSYHGDFQNGWDTDVLQRAINNCRNSLGLIDDCKEFSLQSPSKASRCTLATPAILANESCIGPQARLCGN
ncbi:hypothetical protein CC86DRAFT_238970, partial [Ophiobolus disseminans]